MDSQPTTSDIESLFTQLETEEGKDHQDVIKKLQAIRLWQLMQQEELKQQQQSQLAILKSQTITSISDDTDEEEKDDPEETSDREDVEIDHEDVLAIPIRYDSPVDGGRGDNSQCDVEAGQFLDKSSCDNPTDEGSNDGDDNDDVFDDQVEVSFENTSKNPSSFDDIPLKSKGATFEEILEKELQQNGKTEVPKEKKNISSTPKVSKRTFLRKGQGIARFKGPPPKPKARTKIQTEQKQEQVQHRSKTPTVEFFENKNTANEFSQNTMVPSKDNNAVKIHEAKTMTQQPIQPERQVVRKTSRMTRKEPIKELRLKPVVEFQSPLISRENSLQNLYSPTCGSPEPLLPNLQESAWSDVEDSVLLVGEEPAQHGMDFNKTSNETFEQIEKYCNENYAHVNNIQSLDNESISCPTVLEHQKPAPPPNRLMQKLFPSLKQDPKMKPVSPPQAIERSSMLCSRNEENGIPVDESVQSTLLKKKLEEMELEIKRFQTESSKLSFLREKEAKQLEVKRKEVEMIEQRFKEQSEQFEDFRKSEMKKLKRERKMLDEHSAVLKDLPSKQSRDQIADLEKEILTLQEEMKIKEQRLGAVNSRLRCQLDVAVKENKTLCEKVKNLEETVEKYEKQNNSRKNKKANTVWKAINDIVDESDSKLDKSDQENFQPSVLHSGAQEKSPVGVFKEILMDRNDNVLVEGVADEIHRGNAGEGKKIERRLKDGTQEITFQKGTQKIISPENGSVQIKFTNGDVKTTFPDGTVTYLYIASGTKHTTHPNGLQIIEFNNNQVERHFPDGSKHVSFEDGSSKMVKLDGTEETIFPDGTVMLVKENGEKIVEYMNGQKEVHTPLYKRRTYPDGTCKTVYSDGRQETKYSSGRVRVKDSNGTIVVDTMGPTAVASL
uniref:centromere protein J-like n=1 Tax=Ciona intestinalis TaxID=7719 RepID=UPI000180B7E4|nr:centromere protein J-like [Ciona intestinalis]|eukprot:XP_002123980.1 centromere protein J-like [Ciona intestinalis]